MKWKGYHGLDVDEITDVLDCVSYLKSLLVIYSHQ